jgi:FlaA1/EpsC-like NDP-sugar epimerase
MNTAKLATGRDDSLFTGDCAARARELHERLDGARVLAIGAAGSIGSATVRELAQFPLRCMHVVDHDENGLAELVRDLRGAGLVAKWGELRLLPLDFGSPIMQRFLLEGGAYDLVINFAAVKHVRSEKDSYSALHLLETNVLRHADLLAWLAKTSPSAGYFAVSTDKAANPVNLMGASKRLMEHVIFSPTLNRSPSVTSARFANVAFSNGSLLQGWELRLAKRQPLSVPRDSRRYFVSQRESGQLCLLASAYAPPAHIVVPRLDPEVHLRKLEEIARAYLRHRGYEPVDCKDLEWAAAHVESLSAQGNYPLLLTPLDTEGEKHFEEFVGTGEREVDIGLPHLAGIPYLSGADTPRALEVFLAELRRYIAEPQRAADKEALLALVASAVAEFRHATHDNRLDDRF